MERVLNLERKTVPKLISNFDRKIAAVLCEMCLFEASRESLLAAYDIIRVMTLYPYSTQATNRPNCHELIFY